MTCYVLRDADGKLAIGCGRRATPQRCHVCRKVGQLLCDGCDKPLCAVCSVAPTSKLDFCPPCFEPIFRPWMKAGGASFYAGSTDAAALANGRNAFRAWARANVAAFEAIRTRQSKREVPPSPKALFDAVGGDPEKYRAAMIEAGHLVPKAAK